MAFVSPAGELQLAILIESMRREGFELSVSPPQVIVKEVDGQKLEPYEEVVIDGTLSKSLQWRAPVVTDAFWLRFSPAVDEGYTGSIIEAMTLRRGELRDFTHTRDKARLVFVLPSRTLIGYQSQLKTDTRGEAHARCHARPADARFANVPGTAVMHRLFYEYGQYLGDSSTTAKGSLISSADGVATAYALQVRSC